MVLKLKQMLIDTLLFGEEVLIIIYQDFLIPLINYT